MSFPRHREIFPSDGGAGFAANAPAHRLDEFPAGYSLAGCSPALPASASPTGHQYAVMSSCRSRTFHRTANCVLTVCVRLGGKRRITLRIEDTGDGFDLNEVKGKGGLGLISMEERVRLVRGKFTIKSEPGKGTIVEVFVPLKAK